MSAITQVERDKETTVNAPAPIGHNQPPSPFEEISAEIENLYGEAKNWCDGTPIDNQAQADAVGDLINMIRDAAKRADALRKQEVKPFDEGKAEVQTRYAPLIADTKATKGKTVLALAACKQVLTPWLEKIEAAKREAERSAREEADRKHREAEEAQRQAHALKDLEAREEAEKAAADAKAAEKDAKRATNEKAGAKHSTGRAVSLRTTYTPVLVDAQKAARHYWPLRKSEFEALLNRLAKADVANGAREIPGFEIREEKVAR